MKKTAKYWIDALNLKPHPEGGYFGEVYRSGEQITREALPERYTKAHAFATSIYFLLPGDQFSALHRLKSDEIWHFYLGSPVKISMILADGTLAERTLGPNPDNGQAFQTVIPHGCWFGARVLDVSGFALMGCTVAPGFEFDDFELGKRSELLKQFPQHKAIIQTLTR